MKKKETDDKKQPGKSGKIINIDEAQVESLLDRKIKESVEDTINGLLDAEADMLCGAKRYEHSPDRVDTRAGYYGRKLHTRAGEVELKILDTTVIIIVAMILSLDVLYAQDDVQWRTINVYRKSSISLYVKKYKSPLQIKWGELQKKSPNQSKMMWEPAMRVAKFFLYEPDIKLEKWQSYYSKNAIEGGMASEKNFNLIRSKFADGDSYKKSKGGKLDASNSGLPHFGLYEIQ